MEKEFLIVFSAMRKKENN